MYLYEMEKLISQDNTAKDIQILTNILSNAEHMHIILGELFGVAGTTSWRKEKNILFKKCQGSTAKFLVKSDIPVLQEKATEYNFKVTELNKPQIKNGNTYTLYMDISPFKSNGAVGHKTMIRDVQDRKSWLSKKFEDAGACIVNGCEEMLPIQHYMEHLLDTRNAQMLHGFTYKLNVTVHNEDVFEQIVKTGVGPGKAYGFGLVEIQS